MVESDCKGVKIDIMRDCRDITRVPISKEVLNGIHSQMVKSGGTKEAKEAFRREPYYMTASRRMNGGSNNDKAL